MKVMKHMVTAILIALTLAACGDQDATDPGQTLPAAVASVVVTPASATLVSLGETVQLTASALDVNGNTISGKTFTWSSSDEGIATVSSSVLVTAVANGSVTITATSDDVDGTAAVDVSQVAVQLGFTVAPATPEAGASITPAVEVAIQDALGNTATAMSDAVTVALGMDACMATLSGTTTADATAGIASFNDLSINRAGTGYTLAATASGLSSATTAAFDVVSGGSWTATEDMSVARRFHTATRLNDGRVLIVGWLTQTAELYDPTTGGFTTAGNTSSSHGQGATATRLLDGRVLIVGGTGSQLLAEIFDPAGGAFSPTGSLNTVHTFHTATLLTDGRVLIAAGQDINNDGLQQTRAAAELYDPATGSFSPTGNLNDDRAGHGATLLPDGRVLVVGGAQTTTPGSAKTLTSAEIYDPASGTFSPTAGSMGVERAYVHAIPLHTGRFLVVGGAAAAAELFDPATGTFSTTGSMATPHNIGTATLLSDGSVLVAGGLVSSPFQTIDGAELYDPASGVFTVAATMNESRNGHTATQLLDGRVLVTGGQSTSIGQGNRSSAELFSFPSCTPP
jgi:hypothetical protein